MKGNYTYLLLHLEKVVKKIGFKLLFFISLFMLLAEPRLKAHSIYWLNNNEYKLSIAEMDPGYGSVSKERDLLDDDISIFSAAL